MSRTYRRVGKELPEVYKPFTSWYPESMGFGYVKLYGAELKEALRKFHMEGRFTYGYAPFKCYRKEWSVTQRMHDKHELIKYQKDVEYEPLVFDKMPRPYWT